MEVLYTINKFISSNYFNRIDSRKAVSYLLTYIVQLSKINKMQIVYYFVMEDFFFSRICNKICHWTGNLNLSFHYY
jgi:hypothetical protein